MEVSDHWVRKPRLDVLVAVLSWLGLVVHNVAELGGQVLLGPETVGPTVVYLFLTVGWLTRVGRAAGWLLLGWGWLQLIGGGLLSVLPLPMLPYQPEQSIRHYAFHAVYAGLQIPLLIVLTRSLRGRHEARSAAD